MHHIALGPALSGSKRPHRGGTGPVGRTPLNAIGRFDELLELAEQDTSRPNAAKACANIPAQQLDGFDKTIGDLEDEIVGAHAQSEKSSVRNEVPSIENS